MAAWAAHQTLLLTRALYIGRAAPTPSHEGLDSVQKPLLELYSKTDKQRVVTDKDSTFYILTSGILLMPVNPLDKELWLPVQDLETCVAVKPVTDNRTGCFVFVPTDSPAARACRNPSVFAAVLKRGKGLKISDCYAFLCASDDHAIAMVRECARAFNNPNGWAYDRPTKAQLGLEKPRPKVDHERYVDDMKDDCPPEFYEKPKLSGFFYAPRSDLIQKYSVQSDDCDGFQKVDLSEKYCNAPPPQQCGQPCQPTAEQPYVLQPQIVYMKQKAHKKKKKGKKIVVEESDSGDEEITYMKKGNGGNLYAPPPGMGPPPGMSFDMDAPVQMPGQTVYATAMPQMGMGDYGPPGGMDVYSRRLPAGYPGGGNYYVTNGY